MKTLLINPYIPLEVVYGRKVKEYGAVLPPLGILYIASYLRNKHKIKILDANALKMNVTDILNYVREKDFDIVGFSSTTLAYPYVIEIAKEIRREMPDMILVIGGSHAQSSERILTDNTGLFDYVCYGEAEYAFESLINYLNHKISKEEILGWKYLENDEIKTTPPACVPDNLDVFGHPSEILSEVPVLLYREKILAYKILPMFSIMASRGCPYSCSFCSTPRKFKNLYKNKMKYHSIDWIITELKILQKYGVREVTFVDDTFNTKRDRIIEFCEAKIKNNIDIIWSCNFEVNIADREMMEMMKKAGCWEIGIGGESGSDSILQFIKKGVTKKRLQFVGNLANELGIVSRVSFIIGLPLDTKETIKETINFIRDSNFHLPYFALYMPFLGTEMSEQLNEYGKIIEDAKKMSASSVNYIPHGLTEEYLLHTYNQAYRKVYLRWKMVRNHLQFIRSIKDIKRYLKCLKVLINFYKIDGGKNGRTVKGNI